MNSNINPCESTPGLGLERRHLLRQSVALWGLSVLGAACGVTSLAGCGFQLRGTQSYPFSSIYIPVAGRTPSLLVQELQRTLAQVPGMRVFTDAAQGAQAQVRLDILQDLREKTAVGLSVAGQVREFELRLRVRFSLRTTQGKDLIESTELRQIRPITYNESVALAKESEESQLYVDMQSDLVSQMLRRFSAIASL